MPSPDYVLKTEASNQLLFQTPWSDEHLELAKTAPLGKKILHYTAGRLGKIPVICIPVTIIEGVFFELIKVFSRDVSPLNEEKTIKVINDKKENSQETAGNLTRSDSDIETSHSGHSSDSDDNTEFLGSDLALTPPVNTQSWIKDVDSYTKDKKNEIKNQIKNYFNTEPKQEIYKFKQERTIKGTDKTKIVQCKTRLYTENTEKCAGYESGVSYAQGVRSTMEDEHEAVELVVNGKAIPLFMVLDGHSDEGREGKEVAAKVKSQLPNFIKKSIELALQGAYPLNYCLKAAFEILNEKLNKEDSLKKNWDYAGTTAVAAFILDEHLIVANTGDSRAVAYVNGETKQISEDAKPDDPLFAKTILKNKGTIEDNRVEGIVGTARAFGDFGVKSQPATPKIYSDIELTNKPDDFLIIACDGIWDVLANEQATEIVKNHLNQGKTPSEASQELIKSALDNGSTDNCTAMVVRLFSEK